MASDVLGIIYSNVYDDLLSELTSVRTMGSVPFAGRYRLIDFVLSGMVNAGITKVGVSTKANYQSLMDHLGSGKPWDLSRKNDGLTILPPFNLIASGIGVYKSRIEALSSIKDFISRSNKEYVVLTDCNVVCNIDLSKVLDEHIESGADVTICYKNGKKPKIADLMDFELDGDRISKVEIGDGGKECAFSLNVVVMRRVLLEHLVDSAIAVGAKSFELDIIAKNLQSLYVKGYEVKDYAIVIDSLRTYYDVSMDLLKGAYKDLFPKNNPVYTKVRDDVPAIYGINAKVSDSLIADGCIIKGTVENSILFRGAYVEEGAVVKNSVIMQDGYISADSKINCAILDKEVFVRPNKELSGAETWPLYIGKGIKV